MVNRSRSISISVITLVVFISRAYCEYCVLKCGPSEICCGSNQVCLSDSCVNCEGDNCGPVCDGGCPNGYCKKANECACFEHNYIYNRKMMICEPNTTSSVVELIEEGVREVQHITSSTPNVRYEKTERGNPNADPHGVEDKTTESDQENEEDHFDHRNMYVDAQGEQEVDISRIDFETTTTEADDSSKNGRVCPDGFMFYEGDCRTKIIRTVDAACNSHICGPHAYCFDSVYCACLPGYTRLYSIDSNKGSCAIVLHQSSSEHNLTPDRNGTAHSSSAYTWLGIVTVCAAIFMLVFSLHRSTNK